MNLDPKCYIEIPANKLRDAVKLAYVHSAPQGLGFLHAREGELDDATVSEIIDRARLAGSIAARMDYVHGRSCKFAIYREGEMLLIRPNWYDHSDHQLASLLDALGIADAEAKIAAAQAAQRAENEQYERERASSK